jgi:hypothetical protein
MNTAIALIFLLITTLFTAFVCVMCFALLGTFQKMLDSVAKVVGMTQDILKNGFEIEYLPPDTVQESEQETKQTESVDNTGKVTSSSELIDGVLRVYLPENYVKEEFGDNSN